MTDNQRKPWRLAGMFVVLAVLHALMLAFSPIAAQIEPPKQAEQNPIAPIAVVAPQKEPPPAPAKDPKQPDPLPTENDALALAWADLQQFDEETRTTIRYIWPTDGSVESSQALWWAANHLSRSPALRPAVLLGQKKLMLLRVPLGFFAPDDDAFLEFASTWEELQFDPRFSLLLTRDTLKFVAGIDISQATNVVAKGHAPNVLRFNSPHLDQELIENLQYATDSCAPVVSSGYFLTRALTTIVDDGLYKDLWQGLYYRFAGIKRGFKKGTDLDNLLEKLGVGNVAAGVTAKKFFDTNRSDLRVVMIHSDVTSRERAVWVFPQLQGHVARSPRLFRATLDLKRQSIDISQSPLLNLLDFKFDASEVLFDLSNGLQGFALFNGQGTIQDFVPQDVAWDNTIPHPYDSTLQPPIGCMRCHAQNGGFQKLRNDAKALLTGRLKVLADLNSLHSPFSDLQDRLAGLYLDDPEFDLYPNARRQYALNSTRVTGPWLKSKVANTDSAVLAANKTGSLFSEYNYTQIDAQRALADLGILVQDVIDGDKVDTKKTREKAAVVFTEWVLNNTGLAVSGLLLADARLEALGAGLTLNRDEYALIYSFMASKLKR